MDIPPFRYSLTCSSPECGQPAIYKVAAPWSHGRSHELKNYGLACESHRDSLLTRAKLHRQGLTTAEGEAVGPVGLYGLAAGRRDVQLTRLPDHGP